MYFLGPAQGLGNLGLGLSLMPPPQKIFTLYNKDLHLIYKKGSHCKRSKFYKRYEFY